MSSAGDQQTASPFIPGGSASTGGAGGGKSDGASVNDAAGDMGAVGGALPTGYSEQRRSFTGLLLIVLVVVIAGGVLYMMRQFGLGARMQLLEFKIDYPMDGDGALVVQDEAHRRIIEELRRTVTTVQIPLEDVKKNPFELTYLQGDEPQPTPTNTMSSAEREEQRRRAEISRKLADLKLDSIMGGRIPLARISGKLVRVGDTISDIFLVRAINGRSVELAADGDTYVLAMGEDQ